MAQFSGTLSSNEIFAALYNMILSQQVFADNVAGADLVDQAKVDGGLHGDTKIYYATDALASATWGNDAEAANLLDIARPQAPSCQAIKLDKFRIISVTIDDYLSKRAWSTEGAFNEFNSVTLGWLSDTKKIHNATLYNAFVGTDATNTGKQTQSIDGTDGKTIAEGLANIFTEMTDYNRDFNDYGYLRRYSPDKCKIIFNSKYINKIKNVDLPVIFDNAGLKATFSKEVLPARYFGNVNSGSKVADSKTRSLIEQVINNKHYFAGDLIKSGDTAPAGTSYQEDDTIICKICVLPPFMSSFSTATSFFNPRSLTENHYVIWGYNTLEHLKNYPMLTVKKSA